MDAVWSRSVVRQERLLHEVGRVLPEVRGRWCCVKEGGHSEMRAGALWSQTGYWGGEGAVWEGVLWGEGVCKVRGYGRCSRKPNSLNIWQINLSHNCEKKSHLEAVSDIVLSYSHNEDQGNTGPLANKTQDTGGQSPSTPGIIQLTYRFLLKLT